MSKQEFIKLMSELVAIKKDGEKLNEAFRRFDSDFNYISFGRYESLVVRTLELAVNDKSGWISYFLYERDAKFTGKKIISDKKGKNIPFRNMGDLWDLIENKRR